MEEAANLTAMFRTESEGPKIGQFPSLDGSGNDLTGAMRGKVFYNILKPFINGFRWATNTHASPRPSIVSLTKTEIA